MGPAQGLTVEGSMVPEVRMRLLPYRLIEKIGELRALTADGAPE